MSTGYKYDTLYQELKEDLIELSPGDSFPAVRTIMKEHAVSQATVTMATERLFNEGLLLKAVGKGMMVTEEVLKYKKGAKPIICLAIPHWRPTLPN